MATPVPPPRTFDPAQLTALSQAYETVCIELGLVQQDSAVNRLVARRVIDCARNECDPERIYETVLASIRAVSTSSRHLSVLDNMIHAARAYESLLLKREESSEISARLRVQSQKAVTESRELLARSDKLLQYNTRQNRNDPVVRFQLV